LRLREVRLAQAELAKQHGIEGFVTGTIGSVASKECFRGLSMRFYPQESQICPTVWDGLITRGNGLKVII